MAEVEPWAAEPSAAQRCLLRPHRRRPPTTQQRRPIRRRGYFGIFRNLSLHSLQLSGLPKRFCLRLLTAISLQIASCAACRHADTFDRDQTVTRQDLGLANYAGNFEPHFKIDTDHGPRWRWLCAFRRGARDATSCKPQGEIATLIRHGPNQSSSQLRIVPVIPGSLAEVHAV